MSKITITHLQKMKQDGQKITAITAYDATFAKLFDDEGAQVLLIGDSLGMVLQGGDDTLAVSMDEMVYHTRCVVRGTTNALVVTDMPFMSYATPEQTYQNAARLMAAGARMVKMEGRDWLCDSIRHLTRNGVPVCGHLGLTPQSVHVFGGFKVQGRDEFHAQEIYRQALELQAAGIQLLVLECVPVSGRAHHQGAAHSGDRHRCRPCHRWPDPGNARCLRHHLGLCAQVHQELPGRDR